MTEGVQRETLSALLDDEASELEARRLLRDLDAGDQAAWSRWQLARDIMNGQRVARVPEGFAASVAGQLGEHESNRPAWLARMGRVAVAASVAAATVVGWQYYESVPGAGATPTVAASQEARLNAPVGETALVSGGTGGAAPASREAARHLDGMVLQHSDMSARHSGQGAAPYARLISLQARHGSR